MIVTQLNSWKYVESYNSPYEGVKLYDQFYLKSGHEYSVESYHYISEDYKRFHLALRINRTSFIDIDDYTQYSNKIVNGYDYVKINKLSDDKLIISYRRLSTYINYGVNYSIYYVIYNVITGVAEQPVLFKEKYLTGGYSYTFDVCRVKDNYIYYSERINYFTTVNTIISSNSYYLIFDELLEYELRDVDETYSYNMFNIKDGLICSSDWGSTSLIYFDDYDEISKQGPFNIDTSHYLGEIRNYNIEVISDNYFLLVICTRTDTSYRNTIIVGKIDILGVSYTYYEDIDSVNNTNYSVVSMYPIRYVNNKIVLMSILQSDADYINLDFRIFDYISESLISKQVTTTKVGTLGVLTTNFASMQNLYCVGFTKNKLHFYAYGEAVRPDLWRHLTISGEIDITYLIKINTKYVRKWNNTYISAWNDF